MGLKMQITVYNEKMLDTVVADLYSRLEKDKSLNISYDKPEKPKTKNQLGFFFGALCKSIKDFYESQGIDTYTLNDIKENMYNGCSLVNDRLLKHARRFNGEEYTTPKRLSDMTAEEAGMLIDASIYLIDNARCFNGLILHPSIRYTWIRHLDLEQKKQLMQEKYPLRDNEYLAHIRKQACIWCGRSNMSEPHHLKIAGESGEALKSSDIYAVPLCHECHIGCLHQNGAGDFKKGLSWITDYVDIKTFCKANYLRWKNKI